MSYLRGACGVTRKDSEKNENMYERCGIGAHTSGVMCEVVECVKRNILKWFGIGYIEGMMSANKVYVNETMGSNQ